DEFVALKVFDVSGGRIPISKDWDSQNTKGSKGDVLELGKIEKAWVQGPEVSC
ncbi:21819_t:CDS:2, partial [Gigaspora margarita]